MPFTQEQKRRLMMAYEPVVLLEERERFVPVAPAAYIERSALWSNADPAAHKKELWGQPQGVGGALPPSLFPREPQIRPGKTTLDPSQAGIDDQQYLGDVAVNGNFFLENWGWDEPGEDFPVLASDVPDPGRVFEQTFNRVSHIHQLIAAWGLKENEATVPDHLQPLRPFKYRYAAEVHDINSLRLALGEAGHSDSRMMLLHDIISALGGNPWFIWYYFFYPGHAEAITEAEFRALALRLGLEIEPFTIPTPFNSSALGGLDTKNYAGDFNSVCVIVPGMGTPSLPELPPTDEALPLPQFVGFGKRVRGVVVGDKFGADQIMSVTADYEREGHHVRVYVAHGTHNNYPTGGQKPPPVNDSVYPPANEFDGVDEDTPLPVDDKIKRRRAAAICLGKILGGGLLAGGTACLIEALRDHDPFVVDPGPGGNIPIEVPDVPPESNVEAIVISPLNILENEGLPNVRFWREGEDNPEADTVKDNDVVDDSQIWWPPGTGAPGGYRGTFGPDCADNPFGTRDGLPFPDFKGSLIEGLVKVLLE
jgi:hypothetical protein